MSERGSGVTRWRRRELLAWVSALMVAGWAKPARVVAETPSGAVPSPVPHDGESTSSTPSAVVAETRGRILAGAGGLAMDHIALGVPDMPAALELIRERTGAEPYATDPEPGQWYWSGALALDGGGFLEILGPNPAHEGFHPLKQLIAGYEEPRLLFWYVATDDFDVFSAKSDAAGMPVERVETIDFERNGERTHYKRGILGPGFESQRPCLIEWRARSEREGVDRRCRAISLELAHPDGDAMTRRFREVGIDQVVEAGESWMALGLETPLGKVTFANPGESMVGAGAFFKMTGLLLRYLSS